MREGPDHAGRRERRSNTQRSWPAAVTTRYSSSNWRPAAIASATVSSTRRRSSGWITEP
jgi:hypothetical protein